MNLKHGVDATGVCPQIWYAAGVCKQLFTDRNYAFTITSMRDGVHSPHSKHYSGEAFDMRTRHLPPGVRSELFAKIKSVLDPLGFDTVDEHDTKRHWHCEWDPKPGEKWLTYAP